MVSPTPLIEWAPVQPDPKGTGKLITQYDMYSITDEYGGVGLLKFDFLGIKNLAILADAVVRVQETRDITIDIENVPIDDAKTYEMLARGETEGTFQTQWLRYDSLAEGTAVRLSTISTRWLRSIAQDRWKLFRAISSANIMRNSSAISTRVRKSILISPMAFSSTRRRAPHRDKARRLLVAGVGPATQSDGGKRFRRL